MAGISISPPSIGPPKQQDTFARSAAKTLFSWRDQGYTSTPASDSSIQVVCLADSHNVQPEIPAGDILLHAGDLSRYGTFDEIQSQLKWLSSQPHRWKVVIAGNHDLLLDKDFVAVHPDRELEQPGKGRDDLQWGDLIYLQNSDIELAVGSRKVKIFGGPLAPRFGNFAFQYDPGEDVWHEALPRDTDILLTHGPPLGHLDDNGKGCRWLLEELWRTKPRLVVFGHIHPGRGQRQVFFDGLQECYENVIRGQWSWMNLAMMSCNVLWSTLWRRTRTPHTKYSQLVNAAIAGGQGGPEIREPVVTFI